MIVEGALRIRSRAIGVKSRVVFLTWRLYRVCGNCVEPEESWRCCATITANGARDPRSRRHAGALRRGWDDGVLQRSRAGARIRCSAVRMALTMHEKRRPARS